MQRKVKLNFIIKIPIILIILLPTRLSFLRYNETKFQNNSRISLVPTTPRK